MPTKESAAKDTASKAPQSHGDLHPVYPSMLLPERCGDFELYLAQGESMVLYASRGELFTPSHRERLAERGVERLYVRASEKEVFERFVQDNLGDVLADETIPVEERSSAWFDVTTSLAREAFDRNLPKSLNNVRFSRIKKILRESLPFFGRPEVLKSLSQFVAEGREFYHHGIGVMVLTAGVMNTIANEDTEHLVGVCSGALLHDVGKLTLPEHVFESHPDKLSAGDRELMQSHPVMGVSQCASVQLPQEALHCVLFHHEREDGSGYPSQAPGDVIPLCAKVVGMCDEYENLIRSKPWHEAFTPFEALSRIKEKSGMYDRDLLKRLILVLSRAEIM
ncbi:HD-GYP domain-containing protein [Salidesulfovibrio onnuriiensis]|uniref:HD-GYP domain-containing protein n=1 Tax=Salidesulfovibrio onnuriiensis TaxID=2583823 RepID=UPI0016506108|nr:HD domain-containing phosphohydrolase [Salidesulfovibrio onnuriiensis]